MTGLTYFFLPLSRVPARQSVKGRRPTYCISMKKIKRGQRGRGGLVSKVSTLVLYVQHVTSYVPSYIHM